MRFIVLLGLVFTALVFTSCNLPWQKPLASEQRADLISEGIDSLRGASWETKVRMNERSLFRLNSGTALYKLERGEFPTTNELTSILSTVPMEIFSGTNLVHFRRNYLGGWFYDSKSGLFEANIRHYEKARQEVMTNQPFNSGLPAQGKLHSFE